MTCRTRLKSYLVVQLALIQKLAEKLKRLGYYSD